MEPLRFELFDDDSRSKVVIDPFAVATVVETHNRSGYGGLCPVAVIRLMDGKEYVVSDDLRRVSGDIWLGKSVPNTPPR